MSYHNTWEQRAREAEMPRTARVAKARRALARLDRWALEAVAEAAIAILDEMSDPDEDCCLAGDDGCGAFLGGQQGGMHWGSRWEGEADFAPVPNYGDDQREILSRFGVAWRAD